MATTTATVLHDPEKTTNSFFGQCLTKLGDVNGDGYADVLVGAYSLTSPLSKAYIYLGSKQGVPAKPSNTLADPDTALTAFTGFGATAAGVGDVNGDGYADVVVGAYAHGQHRGKVYFYLGSPRGLRTSPAVVLSNPDAAGPEYFGSSLAAVGDVNGDGYADLLVGSKCGGNNASELATPGRGYLYLGSAAGLRPTPTVTFTDPVAASGNNFGHRLAGVGDVNGDGYADMVIGAPNTDHSRGRLYLYLGHRTQIGATPSLVLADPADTPLDLFGYSTGAAGDVNGDGYADVLVGAYGTAAYRGKAYLYLGSASGLRPNAVTSLADPAGQAGDNFGVYGAGAGDLNQDGYADVLVGSSETGRTCVFFGARSGLAATPSLVLTNPADTSQNLVASAGTNVGDVNGDGGTDLLLGAFATAYSPGQAYLYLGRKSSTQPATAQRATPIELGAQGVSWKVQAYPNPFTTSLTVQLTSPEAGSVTLTLLDATGRKVQQQQHEVLAGSQHLMLNVSHTLPTGGYLLLVRQSQHTAAVHLVHE